MSQLKYFKSDVISMLGKAKWRIIILIFSRIFTGILWYRIDRGLYLLFKRNYRLIRVFLSPLFFMVQAYTNIEIHYRAAIGPGLLILHPAIGIVISGRAIIGEKLTLTGGNVVGMSQPTGNIIIGNNCTLGANACIIGPLTLGNNITIGALACVVKSFEENNMTLVGVPAKLLRHSL